MSVCAGLSKQRHMVSARRVRDVRNKNEAHIFGIVLFRACGYVCVCACMRVNVFAYVYACAFARVSVRMLACVP